MYLGKISEDFFYSTKENIIRLTDYKSADELKELLEDQFQQVVESIYDRDINRITDGWIHVNSRVLFKVKDNKVFLYYIINSKKSLKYEYFIQEESWKISDLDDSNKIVTLTFGENDKTIEKFFNEVKPQ